MAGVPGTLLTRTRSQEWYQRAQQLLVEGVNSPSRGSAVFSRAPVVLERGHGAQVWDVDGNHLHRFHDVVRRPDSLDTLIP